MIRSGQTANESSGPLLIIFLRGGRAVEPQRQRFRGKCDLFTVCLVPGFTAAFASVGSLFDTNLSVLGNSMGHRLLFFVWGWITGGYYFWYTRYLFRLGQCRSRAARWLAGAAGLFMMWAVVIPYYPEKRPVLAALHVLFAFFSPILLAVSLGLFVAELGTRDPGRYQSAWRVMGVLIFTAVGILAVSGFINSFLEMFLVAGICGYLRYLERLLVEERAADTSRGLHRAPQVEQHAGHQKHRAP